MTMEVTGRGSLILLLLFLPLIGAAVLPLCGRKSLRLREGGMVCFPLLCLALALGFASAFAETAEKETIGAISINGAFELRGVLPEGYQLTTLQAEPGRYIASILADESKPAMTISIAYNELMSEVERLNDLDDEALAGIIASFQEEDGVEVSYMETAYGTRLMVVKEIVDGSDYVDFYTVYKGYEIEFVLTQTEANAGQPITDEQIETAVKFLSDLDFVAAE